MYDLERQNNVSNLYSLLKEGEYAHHCFINLRSIQSGYPISQLAFWRSCDRASRYIIIVKPTRCTNFPNLFLEWNSFQEQIWVISASSWFYYKNQPALIICFVGKSDSILGLMRSCLYSITGNSTVVRYARLWSTLGCSDLKQVPPDVPRILR
jgi:hypothetical protein